MESRSGRHAGGAADTTEYGIMIRPLSHAPPVGAHDAIPYRDAPVPALRQQDTSQRFGYILTSHCCSAVGLDLVIGLASRVINLITVLPRSRSGLLRVEKLRVQR